jgi:hypothetical protein
MDYGDDNINIFIYLINDITQIKKIKKFIITKKYIISSSIFFSYKDKNNKIIETII